MICPLCHKESLERYSNDPTLFSCTECHSTHSEIYLIAWNQGWLEGKQPIEDLNRLIKQYRQTLTESIAKPKDVLPKGVMLLNGLALWCGI